MTPLLVGALLLLVASLGGPTFQGTAAKVGFVGGPAGASTIAWTPSKSPSLTVQASPGTGNAPLSVEFWANVTGGTGTPSISWSFGDGAAGSGTPIQHRYSTGGWYNATATATLNASGWTSAATVTVHATGTSTSSPPQLTILPLPVQGSSPLPVTITVAASGGSPPYAGSVCFGDQSPCVPLPSNWQGGPLQLNHTYLSSGTFTIVASAADAQGVLTSSTAALLVSGPGTLSAYAIESPSGGTAPLAVSFVAQASGGEAPYTVLWEFGDGSTGSSSVGVPTTHTYGNGGMFQPVLLVTDHAGHQASYDLAPLSVQAPPAPANTTSTWSSGWFGAHSTEVGGVGLLLVMAAFALLVERRRQQEMTREARLLVEAMEKNQEPP